jgi:hypothetical protein
MTEEILPERPEVSIIRWMWHWPLLFATMAAPFTLFQPDLAKWASIGAGVVYGSWCSRFPQQLWSDLRRPKQEHRWNKNPHSVEFLVTIFQIIVPIMAVGMMLFLIIGWVSWAYGTDVFKGDWPVILAFFVLLVLAPALFLVVAPAFGRKNGGPASKLLKGIRDQGFGHFHLLWLSEVAFVLGMLFFVPMLAFQIFHWFMTLLNDGHAVSILDLAIDFPLFPATLFFAAILLSAPRLYPCDNVEDLDPARAYLDGETIPTDRNKRTKTILGLTVVGGSAATLFFALYPVHMIQVARQTMHNTESMIGAVKVIETLVATQHDAGRSAAEIAAELNRIGSWSPDAPDAGLATLAEEPDRVFVDTCSVRIAAGVTNSSVHGDSQGIPGAQEISDLKFCIAASCASPAPWDAPPALVVVSSHESQTPNWIKKHVFVDYFADGIAPPGGYCAADGGLADRFQG